MDILLTDVELLIRVLSPENLWFHLGVLNLEMLNFWILESEWKLVTLKFRSAVISGVEVKVLLIGFNR